MLLAAKFFLCLQFKGLLLYWFLSVYHCGFRCNLRPFSSYRFPPATVYLRRVLENPLKCVTTDSRDRHVHSMSGTLCWTSFTCEITPLLYNSLFDYIMKRKACKETSYSTTLSYKPNLLWNYYLSHVQCFFFFFRVYPNYSYITVKLRDNIIRRCSVHPAHTCITYISKEIKLPTPYQCFTLILLVGRTLHNPIPRIRSLFHVGNA